MQAFNKSTMFRPGTITEGPTEETGDEPTVSDRPKNAQRTIEAERKMDQIKTSLQKLVSAFIQSVDVYEEWLNTYALDFLKEHPTVEEDPSLDEVNLTKFALQDADRRFEDKVEKPYRAILQLKRAYFDLHSTNEMTLDPDTTDLINKADELYANMNKYRGKLFEPRLQKLRLTWANRVIETLGLGELWTELHPTVLAEFSARPDNLA